MLHFQEKSTRRNQNQNLSQQKEINTSEVMRVQMSHQVKWDQQHNTKCEFTQVGIQAAWGLFPTVTLLKKLGITAPAPDTGLISTMST